MLSPEKYMLEFNYMLILLFEHNDKLKGQNAIHLKLLIIWF